MNGVERFGYATPAQTADIAASAFPTVATLYATEAAMLAALNASGACAVFERFDDPAGYKRLVLGMAGVGSAGNTIEEKVYLVTAARLDASDGLRVDPALTLVTWTLSSTALASGSGGRTNHKECDGVSITDNGRLDARTGLGAVAIGGLPATVEIPDVGEVVGVLRVIRVATATGASPLRQRWK